jgi:ribosome biogenesis protein BMS1
VGKSTLLKSLVRRYTKQTMSEVKGPVTVVAGKKRRLTFVECNNDLNSMIDIGKIADLVLLMIDGSFGFEMVSQFCSHCCVAIIIPIIGNI